MIILNPGESIAAMGTELPGKAPVMPSCGVERTGICECFKSDGFCHSAESETPNPYIP